MKVLLVTALTALLITAAAVALVAHFVSLPTLAAS